jgi:hypothetical protein
VGEVGGKVFFVPWPSQRFRAYGVETPLSSQDAVRSLAALAGLPMGGPAAGEPTEGGFRGIHAKSLSDFA